VARLQGKQGSGMVGPSDTLGSIHGHPFPYASGWKKGDPGGLQKLFGEIQDSKT